MRRHKHLPRFTKAGPRATELRECEETKRPFYLMRRTHGIVPREAPAHGVVASAERLQRLYMHASARAAA